MTDAPRPWIVGESPSRTGDRYHRFPLSGAPAKVLCTCAGFPPEGEASDLGSWTWALYDRFVTANVFKRYADAMPWSAAEARGRALHLAIKMYDAEAPAVVLLGKRVAAAFGHVLPFFEWDEGRPIRQVVVPHPSGRNLLLNDARTRDAIGATLREAVARRQMTA